MQFVKVRVLTLIILAWTMAACAVSEQQMPQLTLHDHPLTGKIWDAANGRFISQRELEEALAQYDYLLLGETHDNPVHHQGQAWVIQGLQKQKRNVGVAFEMIDEKQYDQIKGQRIDSSEQLFDLLAWNKTGWPPAQIYKPLVDSVVSAHYPVYSANLDRKTVSNIVTKGAEYLPQDVKEYLGDLPSSKKVDDKLRKEIEESHCHLMSDEMIVGMMLGQKVRDTVMSLSLVRNKHDKQHSAMVLIAGSGHIVKQQGVPVHLQKMDEQAKIVSVAWVEVAQERLQPDDYAQYWQHDTLPFDYVWFTPRIERPDPCEQIKQHKRKKQKEENEEPSSPAVQQALLSSVATKR